MQKMYENFNNRNKSRANSPKTGRLLDFLENSTINLYIVVW